MAYAQQIKASTRDPRLMAAAAALLYNQDPGGGIVAART